MNKTPPWAYKNYGLEQIGEPKHIKLSFLNKTPQRAYKNYGLENSGPQKHIKTCRFRMRPRSGLIKTMVSEATGAETFIKTRV